MAVFSPFGILLPRLFNAGDAWGEWGASTLERLIGYVPEGLRKYSGLWNAPIRNYNFGAREADAGIQAVSYVISGVIGILAVVALAYIIAKAFTGHEK